MKRLRPQKTFWKVLTISFNSFFQIHPGSTRNTLDIPLNTNPFSISGLSARVPSDVRPSKGRERESSRSNNGECGSRGEARGKQEGEDGGGGKGEVLGPEWSLLQSTNAHRGHCACQAKFGDGFLRENVFRTHMFIDIEDSMDIPIYPDPYGKNISFFVRGDVLSFPVWKTVENCGKLSTPKIPPVPTKDTALVLEEMCF